MVIVGNAREGAESIVLSGNYENDVDQGDRIVYTGEGGNHPGTGQQVADQEPVRGNKALITSFEIRRPVRVIRGSRHRSEYSPSEGFRYDGLYEVVRYVVERGKSGFVVYRFELTKLNAQAG
jgi:putative restriction endonuclease